MNTITIELCQEDRKRLDEILVALQGLKPNCHSCTESALKVMGENLKIVTGTPETPTAPQSAEKPEPVETEHPVEEVTAPAEPEPVAEPETPKPKWTKDDIRKKVRQVATVGTAKWDKARSIIKSYAENVDRVPEDKIDEVMDKLTALDKEG